MKIYLIWQKDFACVVKLRILRCEDYPQLFWWVQCGPKGLYKREARGSKSKNGVVMTKGKAGVIHFEDGGMSHKPRNAGSLQMLEKTRKWILPLKHPEGTQLC